MHTMLSNIAQENAHALQVIIRIRLLVAVATNKEMKIKETEYLAVLRFKVLRLFV